MPLPPGDWTRVREVFECALALPGQDRAAYVAAACGGDQALRDEVERMLDSHGRAAGFLSTPAAAPLDASIAGALDGQRIGPYQLGSRIGAGGMGEVYRARDTRLDRMVAVKVLPSDIVDDPYARERFVREGRAIAALNHPNICALFDVGDTGGSDSPFYLVMEYLEGETLSERLARGALPIGPALQVGAQIASALDAAHRAGIVHRDLKPANVFLVRSRGSAAPTAKLLDFGLAKKAAPRAADSATRHAIAASLTVTGAIVGTMQYMAPEQVEGREVDARTDIFALGMVLHEMLTGAKAFAGTNPASLTVAILEHDPPAVSSRVPSASAALDRVVARCLAKDPDQRWQSAADLGSELQWIVQGGGTTAQPRAANRALSRLVALAVVSVAVLAAAGSSFMLRRPSTAVAPTTKQFSVAVPIGLSLDGYVGRRLTIVPDGSGFVFPSGGTASRDYRWMLHTFADGVSRPLPQTDGAFYPFFSPDGTWLAFFQENRLKKIATNGGPALDICDADSGSGGSWGPDNQIVFARQDGLWRVSALGGRPERLTSLAPDESAHAYPMIMPRGDAVLFTTASKTGAMADATVAAVSIHGGEPRLLVKGATSPRYAPTGHLLYVRGSDLLAIAFDDQRMMVTGNPVRVLDSVQITQQALAAQYDVATDGTIAYIKGAGAPLRTLVWADRNGTLRPIPAPPQPYAHPVLLPDGQGLIVEIEKSPHDLWHYDFLSGALTRLTFEGGNHHAVLSPDGRLMAFPSDRTAPRNLFLQRTDGSGTAERLYQAPYLQTSESWSSDGRWLAFTQLHPQTQSDIWVLAMTGERRARPFLATPYIERSAAFSPDGRWLAYVSNESGRYETFISPFPGPGARKQVSTDGGEVPLFSEDGRTLYYKSGERIMAVDVVTEPAIRIGAPRVGFVTPGAARVTVLPFPVTANGNSVLYVREPDDVARAVHVKVNWFEELRRITAAK